MSGEMLCEKHHERDDCDLEAQQELEPDFDAKGETIPELVFKYRFGLGMLALAGMIFLFGSSVGLGRRRLSGKDAKKKEVADPDAKKKTVADPCSCFSKDERDLIETRDSERCVVGNCQGYVWNRLSKCERSQGDLAAMVNAKRGKWGGRQSITPYNCMRIAVCGCGFDLLDFMSTCCWFGRVITCRLCGHCEDKSGHLNSAPCCFLGFFWDGWCCDRSAIPNHRSKTGVCHQWNLFEIALCGYGISWSPCQLLEDYREFKKDKEDAKNKAEENAKDTKCCGSKTIHGYGKETYDDLKEKKTKPKAEVGGEGTNGSQRTHSNNASTSSALQKANDFHTACGCPGCPCGGGGR